METGRKCEDGYPKYPNPFPCKSMQIRSASIRIIGFHVCKLFIWRQIYFFMSIIIYGMLIVKVWSWRTQCLKLGCYGCVWLSVAFAKAAVSCGLWKNCREKAAVRKIENRLVRAAVSCGKLCAMSEIPVISLKVCRTIYVPKYSYKTNMFTISHVNVSFGKKNIKFCKFFIHMVHINRTVAITQGKWLVKLWYKSL
jgi:hypothetical protein